MKHVIVSIALALCSLLWSPNPAAAAGEGTIPLMVSGRVIGSGDVRNVWNAPGKIGLEQSLRNDELPCLRGMRAKRYLARGELDLAGRMQDVLALCVEEEGDVVEVYTIDRRTDALLRIIGRIRIER